MENKIANNSKNLNNNPNNKINANLLNKLYDKLLSDYKYCQRLIYSNLPQKLIVNCLYERNLLKGY